MVSEADEQATVVEYCELKGIPVYSIPNESKRSKAYGAKLKRQGMRKGIPDLCIPRARGPYHGLYIEMKHGKGKLSQDQVDWINRLRAEGMCAYCCYGARNAISLIDRYMEM